MNRATISNVQYLRFLAAGGVLFSHTADLVLSNNSAVWAVPWTAGVDLFFVISGFIMTWLTKGHFGEPGAPWRYLRRRIIRILPPYWFFTGLMILTVLWFGQHVRNTTIEPIRIATSLTFIPWPRHDGNLNPILSQGWTLNYEAFFYVCFAAALFGRRGLLWLIGGFVALAALHPLVPGNWFALSFYSSPIILEFAGGILLGRLYLAGARLPLAGAIGCCAAAVVAYLLLDRGAGLHRGFVYGIPALLLASGFILAPEPRRLGRVGRLLVLGGDASYTLYLSHTFTVNAVVIAWRAIGWGPPVLAMAAAIGSALAVAILFYKFAEEPVVRWLGHRAGASVDRGPASVAP